MAITTQQTPNSEWTNLDYHANADKNIRNMHYPIGFRSADVGTVLSKSETGDYAYEPNSNLPSAIKLVGSSAIAPTTADGDIYILDNSNVILVITDINWVSGTSVKYTFSGAPDLSGYNTTDNYLYVYGSGIANIQHLGRFVITAVDNSLKTITITNASVTSAGLDETGLTNSNSQATHSSWSGASNGDWVRHNGTDFYRITPIDGVKCFDKLLKQTRTFFDGNWFGDFGILAIASSDEETVLTTGTAKSTFRNVGKFYATSVRASLTVAGTTSAITTVDINVGGSTILSTKLTVDLTEKTSVTAATPAVLSSNLIADDSEITIDIDVVSGGATEKGLKVYILGFYL